MSFSFQASKPPAVSTSGGNAGAGDANKTVSTGFPLMTTPSQGKPEGFTFGTTKFDTATPSTTGFNVGGATITSVPNSNLTMGTMATSTVAPGLNFGTANVPSSGFNVSRSAAATPQSGLSFGISKPATTGFSLGGTTAPATARTTGLTFGNPAATTASSAYSIANLTTTTTSGFNLTSSPATVTSVGTGLAPSSMGATSTPTGFGITPSTTPLASTGFSLSGTSTTVPSTTFNQSTPAASVGFSLGGTTTTVTTPGFKLSSTVPSTTPIAGFTADKTTSATVSTTTSTTTPQTSLGTITTVSSSTSSGQVGSMNFCQLEECINKWTLELEEQEKVFVNQATQVNAWDRLLIANGDKIVTLNQEVERVKLEQQQLEHELDYVVGQQKELEDCLVPLEKELASLSVSDPEREYTYRLAESLDTQLKQMSEDLKEIIEHLNEANRAQDLSDPIVQIGKILNAHMNSLQWLDQRTTLLTQKIQQIDQMHQSFRQENERSFNLAYN